MPVKSVAPQDDNEEMRDHTLDSMFPNADRDLQK